MKSKNGVEERMQDCLDRLNVHLTVVWIVPDGETNKHGEIKNNILFIYDQDQEEAWSTFEHELLEYKFRQVTFGYRTLINGLIESIEKLTYGEKEKFLESLPQLLKVVSETKDSGKEA